MGYAKHLFQVLFLIIGFLWLSACDEVRRIADIPLGTGHSAHELCSRVFVSGQDPALIIEDILVQKVYPLQWIWKLDINVDEQMVSVGAPFSTRFHNATAVHREGQGCTVLHGQRGDGEALARLRETAIETVVPGVALPDDQYWPDGSLGVTSEVGAYDGDAIERMMDGMFEEFSTHRFEQINTYAVLLVHDGRLVAERYAPGHTQENRMLGWSISKSITALLLGILHEQGDIDLSDVVALEHSHDHEVTVQHVLNMASGLDFNEGYEGESDISRMLYLEADASAYARSRPLRHEPGTRFYYSTGDTQILSDIIQLAVGGTAQSAHEFYQGALFHRLSIQSAVVEHDAAGTFIGGARMFMTARDWARIGLLMLNEGRWNGEEIVSKEWIEAMVTPSPAYDGYGGQVWLYEPETFGEAFPKDAYALWGVLGQLVVVVPSRDLVLVRLGAHGGALPEEIASKTVFAPMLEMMQSLPGTVGDLGSE